MGAAETGMRLVGGDGVRAAGEGEGDRAGGGVAGYMGGKRVVESGGSERGTEVRDGLGTVNGGLEGGRGLAVG